MKHGQNLDRGNVLPAHGRARGTPRADEQPASLAARVRPNVILPDRGLPDITGDDARRRLTRSPETVRVPVVVVSGELDAAERVPRSRATGSLSIVHQSVGGADLRTVVNLVLEGRRWEVVAAATRRLLATHPDVEILMLSRSEDEDPGCDGVKIAAHGDALKTAGPDELFDALHRLLGGEVPIPGDVAVTPVRELTRRADPLPPAPCCSRAKPARTSVAGAGRRGREQHGEPEPWPGT